MMTVEEWLALPPPPYEFDPACYALPPRVLRNGKVGAVMEMLFGNARIVVGPLLCPCSADDGWCYDSVAAAVVAILTWDPAREPEPTGWKRHLQTGRRRPDGDPNREYIHW